MTDAASLSVSQIEELIQKKIDASSIQLLRQIIEDVGEIKCTLDKLESKFDDFATDNSDNMKTEIDSTTVESTPSDTLSPVATTQGSSIPGGSKIFVPEKSFRNLEAEYNLAIRLNATRRSFGFKAEPVPFLKSGEKADYLKEVLPPINSVEEIDRISKDQCEKYLELYHVFHDEETLDKWKHSLRKALGISSWGDSSFCFSKFK
ncbi:uncharacterized protein PRCAT00004127001 [Priceomyces carsonii]|uniref:uncharacterized protein n=1 Tax=Priceomyces carsonii TaxID=28549 RepID=UPI002ED77AA5|nr:unnamed protein product [Priceomyces carsonii]